MERASLHCAFGRRLLLLAAGCLGLVGTAAAGLAHLQVEYRDRPLGIDVGAPRFSWQAREAAGERGYRQVAYRVEVRDAAQRVTWDSGKVEDGRSLAIPYAGSPLRAATRYQWTVTAWDARGRRNVAQSTFETGLLDADPALHAWEGATWIGGTDADRVLHAHYFPIFELDCAVTVAPGSQRASLVLAANDPRLMDPNRNLYQLKNARNGSYFRVELDVGAAGGEARLNVYRAGYAPADSATTPFKSFRIKGDAINDANRHAAHFIGVNGEFGTLAFSLDGSADFFIPEATGVQPPAGRPAGPPSARVALNPLGEGWDYITYGYLGEIGFAIAPGQSARFTGLVVRNTRKPRNVLFSEDPAHAPHDGLYAKYAADPASGLKVVDGGYSLDGGQSGAFVVADPSRNSMPMLRTTFDTGSKAISSARLYATARGIYELYLNGRRVGDSYLDPGLTQYNRTQQYQSYDVTALVAAGRNGLGAMLGEGWWSGLLSFGNVFNHFGDRQSLLAKLVVTYADGTRTVVTTNERDWKYFSDGPVRYSSLDMGEVYDATREAAVEGWSTGAYDDHLWHAAVAVPLAGTAFTGQATDFMGRVTDLEYDQLQLVGDIDEPVREYKVLAARSVREVRRGVYVYDMGQNVVGVPRVRFEHGESGRRVVLRVAEMLYPDLPASGGNVGMPMTENYRAALSQDEYVQRAGAQVFQPHFTTHGFRYLEISGLDAPLAVEQVQAVALSSVQRLASSYESSDPQVNQLWSNLTWSNVDNFLSIPTDCPQRNERMGWSGDISVFSRTATYVSDAAPFLRRHMRAMRDTQWPSGKFTDIAPVGGGFGGVLWGSAGITVAWESWLQYGDMDVLREHYPAMKAYVDYLATTIDAGSGLGSDVQLGDWLGPQNNRLGAAFLATAYHVYDLDVVAQAAALLGKGEDAAKYRALQLERKAFFNRTFVNADGRTMGQQGGGMMGFGPGAAPLAFTEADTQTSYAVGLALGAFNDERIGAMQRNLAATVERPNRDDAGVERPAYSLMTGFIGTAWISKALSDAGRADLAYRLLQNRRYPSWLYAVDQGATTIWERLNGYTVEDGFGGNNSMNSFNHYSFGAIGQWLMAYSLGIQRGEPGFRSFVLQPEPDPTGQMHWAKGHYDSPYGTIESAWSVDKGVLAYSAVVPANTTATLYLPARTAASVQEGGRPTRGRAGMQLLGYQQGRALFRLASGHYRFTAPLATN